MELPSLSFRFGIGVWMLAMVARLYLCIFGLRAGRRKVEKSLSRFNALTFIDIYYDGVGPAEGDVGEAAAARVGRAEQQRWAKWGLGAWVRETQFSQDMSP